VTSRGIGLTGTADDLFELWKELPAPLIPSLLDEPQGSSGVVQILRLGLHQQPPQVVEVLGALPIVPCQNLQGHEVAESRYRREKARDDFQHLGGSGDLGFDSG